MAGCSAPPQGAQDCRAIEILVGFGVGGGTDLFARNLAHVLEGPVGKPVQVVNLAGGAGRTAFRELRKRPADGCTLLALTTDYLVLAVFHPEEVDLSELRYLARAHAEIGLLSGKGGGEDWRAMTGRIRRSGDPLLVGGIGARSYDRVAVATVLQGADFRHRYIPYDSAKQMQVDLLSGRLDAVYDEYGVMLPMYESGQARPLLVLNPARIEPLPDTPAAGDLGLEALSPIWRGVAIAEDTPEQTAAMLEQAVLTAMADPAYRDYQARRRLDLIDGFADGPAFASSIRDEAPAYRRALARQ